MNLGFLLVTVTICAAHCMPATSIAEVGEQSAGDVPQYTLARVPPKSAEEALSGFEVSDGYRIELVAAEPLVVDPVAMAFDDKGRLYVVEMRDYSEQDKERLGRVRLLTDSDADGKFDSSQVFVDGLSWPTAVACYNGGVFIGNAPDILYCKDHDGDGVADEQRVVFTGFGRSNVQGLLNSFEWGLDDRVYGATSSAGGQITHVTSVRGHETRVERVESKALDLHGRDFAFDPKSLDMMATTGGGQHGLSFNRWGDRFVCSNSDLLQAIVFEERYLARNPFQSVSSARRSIAADGPQAAVYRVSPVEGWRVARTQLRVAGLVPGPVEGGGKPAGYFTSATGVTVYEGGLWGDQQRANRKEQKGDSNNVSSDSSWVYVADVGSNLIHRKRLTRDGVTYRGERVDRESEFVRSHDIWFRPVQMAIGPEGALYVADMYREVIEHPASLPPDLKRQLDLTSGNDRGRIYRIVPTDFRQPARPPGGWLAGLSAPDLVTALNDANAWRRTTALRLLYERQDRAAVDLLRALLSAATRPEGRIAALYALESLGSFGKQDATTGLADSHPQVRRHALRLSERLLDTDETVLGKVLSMIDDPEPVVQFQLALTLGECRDPRAAQALGHILKRNVANRDITGAVMTSVRPFAGTVLKMLLADDAWLEASDAKQVARALVRQILQQRHEEDLVLLTAALSNGDGRAGREGRTLIVQEVANIHSGDAAAELPVLHQLHELQHQVASHLVRDAHQRLTSDRASMEERRAAIELLRLGLFDDERPLLEKLLSPQEPAAIHAAVLETCAEFDAPEVAFVVLSQWEHLAPNEREQAGELLLRRETWAIELLGHLKRSGTPLTTLSTSQVAKLGSYPSERVRQMANALRGESISADRRRVFDEYREVVAKEGSPARGKLVFDKNCATCHEIAPSGNALAPNLASMVSRGAEALLFNVLVPNGEVDPRYLEYVLVTVDGQVITGIVAGESATAVTVRGPDNKTTTVLRTDIEELRNTGKSLMPEGFEKTIGKPAMADLLTYLQQAAVAAAAGGTSP